MESTLRHNKIPVNIEDEMRQSYMDYAMSVIIRRALPDVRDGLKPVHRRDPLRDVRSRQRVEQGLQEVGARRRRRHRQVPSRTAIRPVYDAIVRMAQEFSMRYPLIDGQGNFGSVDGDPAAAMRYTEIRMARIAGELLADIDKETVEFSPNYDETLKEPRVLPARLPNLLVERQLRHRRRHDDQHSAAQSERG